MVGTLQNHSGILNRTAGLPALPARVAYIRTKPLTFTVQMHKQASVTNICAVQIPISPWGSTSSDESPPELTSESTTPPSGSSSGSNPNTSLHHPVTFGQRQQMLGCRSLP